MKSVALSSALILSGCVNTNAPGSIAADSYPAVVGEFLQAVDTPANASQALQALRLHSQGSLQGRRLGGAWDLEAVAGFLADCIPFETMRLGESAQYRSQWQCNGALRGEEVTTVIWVEEGAISQGIIQFGPFMVAPPENGGSN